MAEASSAGYLRLSEKLADRGGGFLELSRMLQVVGIQGEADPRLQAVGLDKEAVSLSRDVESVGHGEAGLLELCQRAPLPSGQHQVGSWVIERQDKWFHFIIPLKKIPRASSIISSGVPVGREVKTVIESSEKRVRAASSGFTGRNSPWRMPSSIRGRIMSW